MNALLVLFIILVILMLAITGKDGLRNLLGLGLNMLALYALIVLISWQVNAILATAIISILILALAIFMSSTDSEVTAIAFKSSLIVVLCLMLLAIVAQYFGQFQGFAGQDNEELEQLSLAVGLNFSDIAIVVMVVSMLGAVAEAAMAVTADLSELIEQNTASELSSQELTEHRHIISQQILGTAVNTLFFGMLGSSVGLILWLVRLNYGLAQILNSKLLMLDVVTMLLGMLGIILVIWLAGHYTLKNFQHSQK